MSLGVETTSFGLRRTWLVQIVDEPVVERVRDGDGHVALVGGDDERAVPSREGAREELRRELRVDLERIEVDEGEADVRGERLHDDRAR